MKEMKIQEAINLQDISDDKLNEKYVQGHVIIRDSETKEILQEKDNLVLMSTRIWLFQQ